MDEALVDKIRAGIFLESGVKISADDPIFLCFIGQKLVLDKFTQPIVDAMQRLPEELENSLKKIVFAVEEVERTSETLCLETKGALSALAKCEVEAAHQRIKSAIDENVNNLLTAALHRVSDDIAKMERNTKALTDGFRDKKASMLNMVLATAIVGLLGIFSAGLYLLYSSGTKNLDAANYWHGEFSTQQSALKALPPAVKKQLPSKLLID